MSKWQPFIVVEKKQIVPPSNPATHEVILRVKDCLDIFILEGVEADCFKEAYELNRRIRICLSDFVEGLGS